MVSNDYLSFLQQSGSARPPSVLPLMGLRTDVEAMADMTMPLPPALPTSGKMAGGNDLAPTLWGPSMHKDRPLPMWEGARPKTPQQPLGLLERVGLAATMPGMTTVRTDPLGVTEVTFKSGPPTSGHPDEVGNSGVGLNQNVVDDHHSTPFLGNRPRAALPTRTSRHCPPGFAPLPSHQRAAHEPVAMGDMGSASGGSAGTLSTAQLGGSTGQANLAETMREIADIRQTVDRNQRQVMALLTNILASTMGQPSEPMAVPSGGPATPDAEQDTPQVAPRAHVDNQPPLLTRGSANYDYAQVGPASPRGGQDLVTQDYFRQPMPALPQLPSGVEGARGCPEPQPGYGHIGHQPNQGATGPSGWPHGQGAWPEYLNSPLVRHEERPPKFDSNVDDWHHYIRAFEAVAEMNGWTAPARKLATCMTRSAQKFTLALPREVRTNYFQFRAALEQNFDPLEKREAGVERFLNRVRLLGESLTEYGQALSDLAHRAYPEMPDLSCSRQVIGQFIRGLQKRECRMYVKLACPKTLSQAMANALMYETFDETDSNPRAPAVAAATSPKDTSVVSTSANDLLTRIAALEVRSSQQEQSTRDCRGNSRITCWNCGNQGHRSNDCRQPRVGNGMQYRPARYEPHSGNRQQGRPVAPQGHWGQTQSGAGQQYGPPAGFQQGGHPSVPPGYAADGRGDAGHEQATNPFFQGKNPFLPGSRAGFDAPQ